MAYFLTYNIISFDYVIGIRTTNTAYDQMNL
jgi:hypothetical protein